MEEKGVFIYAKVPTHDIRSTRFLENKGFYLVDTNVTFEGSVSPGRDKTDSYAMRLALKKDEKEVSEIARNSFIYSRFHLDPAFPAKVADQIKSEWVRNFFKGKRGDAMVIALQGKSIMGFLQLFCNNGILTIDQIAVSEKHQRRGIAVSMILYAQEHCKGIKSIRVGTQISNIPAMRLYEKLGLKVSGTSYVLHYHNLHHKEGQ